VQNRLAKEQEAEMRYCEISKEMSSLYSGLALFCPFEARVPEFDTQPIPSPVQCTMYIEHCVKFWESNFKLAVYIKHKIQRRHLFADLRISHLWREGLQAIVTSVPQPHK
jgi:hypothetical protein